MYKCLMLCVVSLSPLMATAGDESKPKSKSPVESRVEWDRLEVGHWAKCSATLSAETNGNKARIDAMISTHNNDLLAGFCASAVIDLLDQDGNVLQRVNAPSVGQNARITLATDRSKPFYCEIENKVAASVHSIRVTTYLSDPPPLKEQVDNIVDAVEGVFKAKKSSK